jgi:hypothetical protein
MNLQELIDTFSGISELVVSTFLKSKLYKFTIKHSIKNKGNPFVSL